MTVTERVLAHGGEAGALARSIDWSRTAIGPVERWSQALRSTVALILHNHSGLLLWWGPEFIQIYNDAYRPVLGDKHPRALGQPAGECWSEIWHIIGPMITEILERAHARVTVAASAAEAMDVLARLRPAVLVSDIGMPDEDGFTLMRRVRALPEQRGGRIPAVALTAYARAVDRQQAMMAGYDIHLGKPVDPGELVDVVASLARRADDDAAAE
jgi:CheY-like chemotaxis protein